MIRLKPDVELTVADCGGVESAVIIIDTFNLLPSYLRRVVGLKKLFNYIKKEVRQVNTRVFGTKFRCILHGK